MSGPEVSALYNTSTGEFAPFPVTRCENRKSTLTEEDAWVTWRRETARLTVQSGQWKGGVVLLRKV